MKTGKKVLSLVLALVMLFSALPATVFADTASEMLPYAFTDKIGATVELKSEVYLIMTPELAAADGTALTTEQAQAIEANVGILMWDAAEAPAEAEATIENAATVYEGSVYNTVTKRFDVSSTGIAAKNLGDEIAFRPYYTDGNGNYIYGKYITTYSPKNYCYNQLVKSDDVLLHELCIAILNYGTAAQIEFNYNTENLMNSGLTDDQKAWTWDESLVRSDWTAPKGDALARQNPPVVSRGATLELKGALNLVFTAGVSGIDVAEAKVLVWTEEQYNAVDALTVENATVLDLTYVETVDGVQTYEYVHKGIAAKDMFHPVYACHMYTDTDGNVYYGGVLAYCAERYGYIHRNDTDAIGDLAKTLVIYGNAARTYFASIG